MGRTFSTKEHWKFFAEFCEYEKLVGGPDPHMKLAVEMSRGQSIDEKVWRGGCYIAVYNAPFAEALWREWPWDRICQEEEDLDNWLVVNWSKIITRRERRCVRRPEWMAQYLKGFARFASTVPGLIYKTHNLSPTERYEVFWDAALEVPRLGRYVALKLQEFLRHSCGVDLALPDLRPEGGWSPREMLGVLFPKQAQVGARDDSPELLTLANKLAKTAQHKLAGDYDVKLDMFDIQVLLCDYKQSWKSQRQYPGRSIDSELMYCRDAERLWGYKSDVWAARVALFKEVSLGEVQGWDGPRDEAASVLVEHGYTWSDLKFDFKATHDFSCPVERVAPPSGDPPSDRVHPIVDGKLFQSGSWNKVALKLQRELVSYYGITDILALWGGEESRKDVVSGFRKYPLADGKKLNPSILAELVEEVVDQINAGGRVLVMCHAGRNRSALITALTARQLLRCSGKEAVGLVRRKRPRALANEVFATYIERLPRPPKMGELL